MLRKGRETSVEDLSQRVSTQPGPVHRSLPTQADPRRVPLSAYGFCALSEWLSAPLQSRAFSLPWSGKEALQEHKFRFIQTDIVTAQG